MLRPKLLAVLIFEIACSSAIKAVSYKCIVRPDLEYATLLWYLHFPGDIACLENVQYHAAHWVCDSIWKQSI